MAAISKIDRFLCGLSPESSRVPLPLLWRASRDSCSAAACKKMTQRSRMLPCVIRCCMESKKNASALQRKQRSGERAFGIAYQLRAQQRELLRREPARTVGLGHGGAIHGGVDGSGKDGIDRNVESAVL